MCGQNIRKFVCRGVSGGDLGGESARAHFKVGARRWGSGGGRARKLSRVGKRQGHLGPITD